ncbi:hypothetical protein PENTCL1PPCAC_12041, partial [Pristionchus entomophagus]
SITQTTMAHNESTQDNPPEQRERKMSFGSSSEPRMRTRSFGKNSGMEMHIVREYAGDEMDRKLSLLKLVKKAIARDNTSIFRAVCEQISSVQTDHQDLRILVENILRPITQQFVKNNPGVTYDDRDKDILEILCDITSSRIKVYRALSDEPTVYEGSVVEENREIQVCETQFRAVYAPVYSAEMHEALGISQSIVYHALYKDVFKMPKKLIDDAIRFIRNDIDQHCHTKLSDMWMMDDHHMHAFNAPCCKTQPPFPFCACKSLDPSIYRNVEYDLYRKKARQPELAAQNSLAAKFGVGARCQVRDGKETRPATVVNVVKHDVRKVVIEDGSNNPIFRDYDVSDLRPLPTAPVAYNSMQALMSGVQRGPHPPMGFLPGCGPPPPFVPPPLMYGMAPATSIAIMMARASVAGPPPSPPPYYSSPPAMMFPPPGQHQQHFSYGGSNEMMAMPPPSPMMEGQMSFGFSPAPADSSLDSSAFSATPVSSKKGERRTRDKKPRALSVELTDSPTGEKRPKENGLTWWQDPTKRRQEEGEKRKGGRRATVGDTIGEMNRQLQPKQQLLLSTCSSVPENDSPALPSLMDPPMQQLQLQTGPVAAASAAAAARGKLPSLFPLPTAQARSSYYSSSGELSDGVFISADEGVNTSQTSLSNNRDSPLVSSSSVPSVPQMGATTHEFPCTSLSVPYITLQQYDEVNKNARYSMDPDGNDLPDMATIRFYYNMGLHRHMELNNDPICPPPPNTLPMPAEIFSPTLPPQSPMMFFPPNSVPYAPTPSAPPPTPCVSMHPSLPSHLYQYIFPAVEGMPAYSFDHRGGVQMMGQGPMNSVPSPSPMMSDGQGNVFFN